MQKEYITLFPFMTYTDEIMRFSFIQCISYTQFRTIKLPVSINRYQFSYLLTSQFLIDCELIHTRKNWILKDIKNSTQLFKPESFADFQAIQDFRVILKNYYSAGSDSNMLQFLIDYFKTNPLSTFNKDQFNESLSFFSGFTS